MYQDSKKVVAIKEYCCFDHSDFLAHLLFAFDVCWGSLDTSIFRNSSSAASNTRSRLPSRLSVSYDYELKIDLNRLNVCFFTVFSGPIFPSSIWSIDLQCNFIFHEVQWQNLSMTYTFAWIYLYTFDAVPFSSRVYVCHGWPVMIKVKEKQSKSTPYIFEKRQIRVKKVIVMAIVIYFCIYYVHLFIMYYFIL